MCRAALLALLGFLLVGKAKAEVPRVHDFRTYALHSWSVRTTDGRRIPFRLNVPQRIVDYEIRVARADGRAALVKVLKSRRQGISTYACARMQHLVQTVPGARALSMADKADLPRQWLRRAQGWHEQQPAGERPDLKASSMVEMYYEGQQSRYWIASAEGKTPAMGDQIEGLHASEIENYLGPAKLFADLNPSFAVSNPLSLSIWESTGELEGSYWHEQVLVSVDGADGWRLVFLPWYISPEYSRPTELTADDYTPEERLVVEQAAEWAKANPVHAAIAEFEGIVPGQIEWRRFTISTFFSSDVEMFACRYPATISEAFLGIGSLALPVDIVRQHKATARAPLRHVVLERQGKDVVALTVEPDDPRPHWRIYEEHEAKSDYALGADVAEGAVSDLSDERSERDYSAIMVLHRRRLFTSALFHGRIEPDKLGDEMLKGADYWNRAWICPEVNSAGMAVLTRIRGYSRVMPRAGAPDTEIAPDQRPLDRLGWKTTPITRDLLIDEYVRDCRAEAGDYAGKLTCLCPELAREEGTFIRTKLGKREHRAGCHDDIIIATMIAMTVHRTCPRTLGYEQSERAALLNELSDMVHAERIDPSMLPGGVEPEYDDDEDDVGGISL